MVNIPIKDMEILVKFPKNSENLTENNLSLILKSEITGKSYRFDDLEDNGGLYNYHEISLFFGDIPDGEYIYTLFNENTQSIGLLRIGSVKTKSTTTEYVNTDEYEEYQY